MIILDLVLSLVGCHIARKVRRKPRVSLEKLPLVVLKFKQEGFDKKVLTDQSDYK